MPISDDPVKMDFFARLSDRSDDQEKHEVKRRLQEQFLHEMTSDLDKEKEGIRQKMDFEVEDRRPPETKKGKVAAKLRRKPKKIKSMDKGGQIESIESEEAMYTSGLSQEDKVRTQEAMDSIVGFQKRMMEARGPDGSPLFTEDEIRRELYEPLVREQIMPENLVPNEYSTTQRTLDKSMGRYQDTLTEENTKIQKAEAHESVVLAGGGSAAQHTAALIKRNKRVLEKNLFGMVPGGGTLQEKKARMGIAKDRLTEFTQFSLAKFDVVEALGDAYDAIPLDDREALEGLLKDEMDELLPFGVSDSSSSSAPSSPSLASEVTSNVEGALKTPEAIGKEAMNIAIDAETAVQAGVEAGLIDGISQGAEQYLIYSTYTDDSLANRLEYEGKRLVAMLARCLGQVVSEISGTAGRVVAAAFRNEVSVDAVINALHAQPADVDGTLALLSKGIAAAVASAAPSGEEEAFAKLGAQLGDVLKVDRAEMQKALLAKPPHAAELLGEAAMTQFPAVLGTAGAASPEAEAFLNALLNDEHLEKLQESVAERTTEKDVQRFQQDQVEFEKYRADLLSGEAGDLMGQTRTIEKLIKELRLDKIKLKWAATLAQGIPGVARGVGEVVADAGMSVLEGVGPALRAAGLTAKLVINIIQAAQRWDLWYKFREQYQDALTGGSVISIAIKNFWNNKKEQIAYHTIEDAMIVAQIGGSLIAAGGSAAHAGGISAPIAAAVTTAGKAIYQSARAGEAINKTAWAQHDYSALKSAWRITKLALQNPKNRRVGLEAQLKNPTLAMHAVAWAAIEEEEPFAVAFLNSCGLNERTLADPASTEANVRKFLSVLLDEDRVMLDPEKALVPWRPPHVALTRQSWLIAKRRGETKATPTVKPEPTPAIEAALRTIEEHGSLTQANFGQLRQYLVDVSTLSDELGRYAATGSDGHPHTEMKDLVEEYRQLAEKRRSSIEEMMRLMKPPVPPRAGRPQSGAGTGS